MPVRGGAAKARRSMRKRYGKKRGDQIFFARANKYGRRGRSLDAKVRSTYKRGAKLRRRRRSRR